jgi:hypothetical protein
LVGYALDEPYANTPFGWLDVLTRAWRGGASTPALAKRRLVAEKCPCGAKYDATYDVLAETGTGLANITCCHPEPLSASTILEANRFPDPVVDQRLPMCVPEFAAAL